MDRNLRSHGRVVHQNVQGPTCQTFLEFGEQCVDVSAYTELSPHEKRLSARLFNRLECLLSGRIVAAVVDRNQRTIGCQSLRDSATNSPRASRD